jgi:glutathione S-transferase
VVPGAARRNNEARRRPIAGQATGNPAMRLYTFTITPNNRKVEAFVRHYDLDVDVHHVSFKDKETQSPAYLAINPMAKVPALTDGDFKLWESNAILTYLATKFPQTNALPADPRGRADVDRWLHWQSCHLMPAMGALKVADEKDVSAVTPLLKILDTQLKGRDYILGKLTVVDFAIAAYLMTKMGRQLDYSGVPNLSAWVARMSNLKGFVETQVKAPPAA